MKQKKIEVIDSQYSITSLEYRLSSSVDLKNSALNSLYFKGFRDAFSVRIKELT